MKFGISCSKNWDPEVAGVEATTKALEQIGEKPKFLLIFCTIHYAKEKDGLKKLLYGCRSLIDKEVPSIGGTVTGFICPEGCHTRGVVVVAGNGDIEIASAYEEDTRTHPQENGKKLAIKIANELKDSKRKNKVLLEFMPGPKEPTLMTSKTVSNLITLLYKKFPNSITWKLRDIITSLSTYLFNCGPGREEDTLLAMSEILKDYYIAGCSTFDDLKSLHCYQFYNEKVLDGATTALSFSVDNNLILSTVLPLIDTKKKFKIKRGWNNFFIDKINENPANEAYIQSMGWPQEYINAHVEKVFHKTFYSPFLLKNDDSMIAFPAGFFFGESIVTNRPIKKDEITLSMTSSRLIVDTLRSNLDNLCEQTPKVTLIIEATEVIGILGEKLYVIKHMIDSKLKNSQYLMIFGSGEHSKRPGEKSVFNNFSRVALSILEEK